MESSPTTTNAAATSLLDDDNFDLDIFPSTPQHQQPAADLPPTKKVRYDKLGREIKDDDDDESNSPPRATTTAIAKPPRAPAETTTVLKRPRGRTPKGKVWDEKRGYVNEGLRGFN